MRWLYVPLGIVGIALLLLVFLKAEDPVHAIRFTGFTMAVAGALPIGLGLATPLFAAVGENVDPLRGPAVAAFIKVLLGRLVAAGWVLTVLGLLLVFVPGRDGLTSRPGTNASARGSCSPARSAAGRSSVDC